VNFHRVGEAALSHHRPQRGQAGLGENQSRPMLDVEPHRPPREQPPRPAVATSACRPAGRQARSCSGSHQPRSTETRRTDRVRDGCSLAAGRHPRNHSFGIVAITQARAGLAWPETDDRKGTSDFRRLLPTNGLPCVRAPMIVTNRSKSRKRPASKPAQIITGSAIAKASKPGRYQTRKTELPPDPEADARGSGVLRSHGH
jgi:hypothetical protein